MVDVEQNKPQCKVVTAVTVAQHLSKEVRADLAKLGRSPQLVGFLANADPAARMYANWTKKTCSERWVSFFSSWLSPFLIITGVERLPPRRWPFSIFISTISRTKRQVVMR